jgi:hypothetical protein
LAISAPAIAKGNFAALVNAPIAQTIDLVILIEINIRKTIIRRGPKRVRMLTVVVPVQAGQKWFSRMP